MALKLKDLYTYIVGASAAYPWGSFKNASASGAQDGTPFEKQWPNDIYGFLQALLGAAGIVPSGAADTAQVSQYLQAIQTLITDADVDKVDGFHASTTPGPLEILVADANGDVNIGGDFITFLKGTVRHYGASNAISVIGGRDKTRITVNAYFDGNNHVRLVTGAAYMVEIDRTVGAINFYTAANGAVGTVIAWAGPYKVWHAGNVGAGSGLDADTVHGISFYYFTYTMTSRDTNYAVNIGVPVRFVVLNNLTSGNGQVTKCWHTGNYIYLNSQADNQSVEVMYII